MYEERLQKMGINRVCKWKSHRETRYKIGWLIVCGFLFSVQCSPKKRKLYKIQYYKRVFLLFLDWKEKSKKYLIKFPKKSISFFNNEDFSFFNWHGRARARVENGKFLFLRKRSIIWYWLYIYIYLIPSSDSPAIKC